MAAKHTVGIVGVTGYTGVELLRIVHQHPELELSWMAAGQSAGTALGASWPGWQGLEDRVVCHYDPDAAAACDVVFFALPHGQAAALAPELVDRGVLVVDLGADFRLKNPDTYAAAYGKTHPHPQWLKKAVYGLAEWNRPAIKQARLVANPGCYPTAVALAAMPLVQAGHAGDWLVADCISGVSGAGRKPGPRNLYCETVDSAGPYGMGGQHRHVPEMEQTLGVSVTFTPHLAPMSRGMVATVHARLTAPIGKGDLQAMYAEAYAGAPMVTLRDGPPVSADVRGTNRAHIHATVDSQRGVASITCVIDNLVKGAAGQAVQCMNLALGLPESTGLPVVPLLP